MDRYPFNYNAEHHVGIEGKEPGTHSQKQKTKQGKKTNTIWG